MDKTIATALLVIASVIAAVALTNAVLPMVGKGSSAILTASETVANRVRTDLSVVFTYGDTANTQLNVWVKNVGVEEVLGIESSDLFLTTPDEVKRVPYGAGTEYWTYTIEGGTRWTQAVTVKITVELSTLPTGQYKVKLVVPNGAVVERTFSI